MVKFLEYVRADLNESQKDFEDEYVATLQKSVQQIKAKREMEESFMLWQLLLRDERREGKAEGKAEDVLELLAEFGNVPQELQERIMREEGLIILKSWVKLAAKSESIEQFIQKM